MSNILNIRVTERELDLIMDLLNGLVFAPMQMDSQQSRFATI